ncbi:HutD/Ves family protein [Mesorhizobium sp. ORM8.1]
MRILRAAGYRVMPWKNGGGTTTEIAVSPEAAGLDDFDWRISMARVETSGPFSSFPGVDRTLSVLEEEGIVLDIAGRPPARLTATSAPLSFPGDVPTGATLIGGPITDLNVMTRRGRTIHQVERLTPSAPLDVEANAGTTLILPLGGELIVPGDKAVQVGPLDVVVLDQGAPDIRLESVGNPVLFVIRIDRTKPAS